MIRTVAFLLSLLMLVGTIVAEGADARTRDRGYGPPRDPDGRFVEMISIESKYLPPQRVTIWLPPGYYQEDRTYGVVYMHDAQNLFFAERSGFNKVWAADKSVIRLIKAKKIPPVIVVGIWHPGKDRYRQYLPQKLYEAAPAAMKADMGAGGPIISDAYLKFIVDDLKPIVDEGYRTRKGAKDTAIIGSSMGGLISCYAFMEYPQIFGRAACVSTHWPLVDPEKVTDGGAAAIGLWDQWLTQRLGKPKGRKLWMDHGTATLDSFYGPYQQAIDAKVQKLGWKRGRDFESRVYQGAEHEENAWASRLDDILTFLFAG